MVQTQKFLPKDVMLIGLYVIRKSNSWTSKCHTAQGFSRCC